MLLLPDVLHCKHLLVCRRWGGLNGSFSSTDTSSSQKSNVCFYCRAAAFREHFRTFKFSIFLNRSYEFKRQGFSSGVYWQRGDRECYMVRARRVDTADFMQGKYLSCSHQVLVCACQTLTAFINHIWACTWLLGAHRDTYRGHVSWLVATQAGVSEPLLSIMAAGW